MSFFHDLKIAIRSLSRVRALWITVALTLALGIGANAAIFSVVRAVLLRPLANRDEDRLLYVRQSAEGMGQANTTFSVPEIKDSHGYQIAFTFPAIFMVLAFFGSIWRICIFSATNAPRHVQFCRRRSRQRSSRADR